MIELRPFQIQAIDDLTTVAAAGKRRLLLQAATGAGKTVIAARIINHAVSNKKRVLFLAHRRELVGQAVRKLEAFGVSSGTIMSGDCWDKSHAVNVASIQTLHSWCIRRKHEKLPTADLVVIDEAHHYNSSKTWQDIVICYPEAILLGMTATPINRRGRGLGHFFDEMVRCPAIPDLTDRGYLVPARYYIPSLPDLRGLKVQAGDYIEKQLEERMDVPKLIGDVCENWSRICPDRKTLVFASGVKHSIHITEAFNSIGVKAAHVDGQTPKDERDRIVDDFSNGDIRVLSNCSVFNEGIDIPVASALVFARPTKSLLLYLQVCLDDKTEILTPNGWARKETIENGDMVGAFDIDSEIIRFVPARNKIVRVLGPTEKMVTISSPHLDIRITDTHDFVWRPRNQTKDRAWRKTSATQLTGRMTHFQIPIAGKSNTHGVELTDDELRFIGLFLSDGTKNKINGVVSIAQSLAQPESHHAYIRACLSGCGLKFGVCHVKRTGNWVGYADLLHYYISRGKPRGTKKHLRGWGYLDAYIDKNLSPSLEKISSEQLSVLLDALNLGDGAKRRYATWEQQTYSIFTGNKTFADRLQSLCIRTGWRCNIAARNPNKYSPSIGYMMHISNKAVANVGGSHSEVGRAHIKINPGLPGETVWCVENDIGTLVSRRNGKVSIVGNCGRVLRPFPGKQNAVLLDHSGAVYEHGPIHQDWQWKLDYGEGDARKETRKVAKLKKEITCGQCKQVYFGRLRCPGCDWKPILRGREVETYEGYLQALDEIEHPKPDEKSWYLQLLGFARSRNKKDGYAYFKFLEKFKTKPPWSWKSLEALEPGPEVLSWLRSQNIRWAKNRRNPMNAPVG